MDSLLLSAGGALVALAIVQARAVGLVAYPPALLSAVWGGGLVWLGMAGNRYSPISILTLAIYLGGTVAFCIGGALGWMSGARESPEKRYATPEWLVPVLTLTVVILTPFYVARVLAVVGTVSPAEFLFALRVRTLDTTLAGGIGVIGNVVPFATMSAMLATALPPYGTFGRVCRGLVIVLALALAILTGGRGAPLSLIFGVAAVAAMRARTVPVRHVMTGLLAAILVFGAMGVLVRKGAARPEASLAANAVATSSGLELYALSGMVGFNRIVDDPRSIPTNGGFLRTARDIANRFGARYEIPSQHLQWTSVGDAIDTNVYTMYSAYYPEVGYAGTLCLTLLVGLVSAFSHRRAIAGSLPATLFFGVLASSTLQSAFGEPFYTNLNFLGKLTIFVIVVTMVMRRPSSRAGTLASLGMR